MKHELNLLERSLKDIAYYLDNIKPDPMHKDMSDQMVAEHSIVKDLTNYAITMLNNTKNACRQDDLVDALTGMCFQHFEKRHADNGTLEFRHNCLSVEEEAADLLCNMGVFKINGSWYSEVPKKIKFSKRYDAGT